MKNRVFLLLIALMSFTAIGCGSSFNPDDYVPPIPPDPPSSDRLNVRVAHLMPDFPAAELRVNGQTVSTDFAYEDVTLYTGVEPGHVSIELFDGEEMVLEYALHADEPNAYYTIAFYGEFGDIRVQHIFDDVTSPGEDAFRLRLFHAASNWTDREIVLTDEGGTPILYETADYGELTAYSAVLSRNFEVEAIQVRDADDDTVLANYTGFRNATADVGDIGSSNITVFAAGNGEAAGQPLIFAPEARQFVSFIADPTDLPDPDLDSSFLRVAHMVPGELGAGVDLFLTNPEQADFESVSFEEVTDYEEFEGGDYVISVVAQGADDAEPTPIWTGPITLEEGAHHTLTLIANPEYTPDTPGSQPIEVLFLTDDVEETAGAVKLRFVHTMPDAPDDPIYLAIPTDDGFQLLTDGVTFGQATEYASVPATELAGPATAGAPILLVADIEGDLTPVGEFRWVRPTTDVPFLGALAQRAIDNGLKLNITAFAAAVAGVDELKVSVVSAIDSEAAGGDTVISDYESLGPVTR